MSLRVLSRPETRDATAAKRTTKCDPQKPLLSTVSFYSSFTYQNSWLVFQNILYAAKHNFMKDIFKRFSFLKTAHTSISSYKDIKSKSSIIVSKYAHTGAQKEYESISKNPSTKYHKIVTKTSRLSKHQ